MNTNEVAVMDKKRKSVEGSDGKKKAKKATDEEEAVTVADEEEELEAEATEDQGEEEAEEEVLKDKDEEEVLKDKEAEEEDMEAEDKEEVMKDKEAEEEDMEAEAEAEEEEDTEEDEFEMVESHKKDKDMTPRHLFNKTPRQVGRPKKTVSKKASKKTPTVSTPVSKKASRGRPTQKKAPRGRPKTDDTPTQKKAPRGRPKKVVAVPTSTEKNKKADESNKITALRAFSKLAERRSDPISTSGKRGAVSYEDMFKNTKILTHNTDTEANMVRVEGIVEFERKTKSFNVFWETEDEPPLLKLSKQDMDVLVANSKQLDLAGLIESYIGHTVITKHSLWKQELMICITDKHNVPMIIQYDTRPISTDQMKEDTEHMKLGDSLMINLEVEPLMLTETLQLELAAYDDDSAYIKYVTGFVENDNLKFEMSFTKMSRVEYGELDVAKNLDAIEIHDWPVWYKKYHVCDKYSTEFLEYVRRREK
jgi:hypothetical protein